MRFQINVFYTKIFYFLVKCLPTSIPLDSISGLKRGLLRCTYIISRNIPITQNLAHQSPGLRAGMVEQ